MMMMMMQGRAVNAVLLFGVLMMNCLVNVINSFQQPSPLSQSLSSRALSRPTRTSTLLKSSTLESPSSSSTTSETPDTTDIDPTAAASSSEDNSSHDKYDKFDYYNHWYPVIWKQDLQYNVPTKVTIFDVDYVISKILNDKSGEDEIIALHDVCPHKLAKLSQGRVTSSGDFQCAYHGWSFNGKSGQCVEIPQVVNLVNNGVGEDEGEESTTSSQTKTTMPSFVTQSSKSSATAVPAMIQYDMVWLFPGGNLEKALLAPPPPTIPELEPVEGSEDGKPEFQLSSVSMRDMPIDFPILLSNICDPDQLSISICEI